MAQLSELSKGGPEVMVLLKSAISRHVGARTRWNAAVLLTAVLPLVFAGCVTTFHEDHFFQSVSSRSGRATNYFRVRVDGQASLSTARYISGYYDERAVDLFFNEVKSSETLKLFEPDSVEPGTTEKIKPLSPDDKNGALVMILSTNAKAVTDAIGQFAESQITADALTNLVNRRDILDAQRATARLKPEVEKASAVSAELTALFAAIPAATAPAVAPPAPATEVAYVRILNAIAAALGATQSFATLNEAAAWFRTIATTERDR
jgi:hypothetical protein